MSLNHLLQQRLQDKGPVRVGLIGAGKFGSMFLSQVPTTAGLEVSVIADLDRSGPAKSAARSAGKRSALPAPASSKTAPR